MADNLYGMTGARVVLGVGLVGLTAMGCGGDRGGGDDGLVGGGIGMPTEGNADGLTSPNDESDGGEKLDIGSGTDLGPAGDCGDNGMGGDTEFSYIWIANSPNGTVSKIDTATGVEVGRYYTGPTNGQDDPSRTSVNLAGDIAVTNRSGSITKIAAQPDNCVDSNGDGVITTSTGAADVKPFGEDECVLWTVNLPAGQAPPQGPRPTAWDTGDDGNPCTTTDDRVWVGYFDIVANAGHFFRLNGLNGSIDDEAVAANWDVTGGRDYGPYGGATDADGHFWVTGLRGPLVKIDAVTLQTQQWEMPASTQSYGMTLDADGHVWTAGLGGELAHFDPDTQLFDVYAIGSNSLRGLQIDRDGIAWVAVNGACGVAKFDVGTRTVVNPLIPLPGCDTPVGVSIDVEGFVWIPDQGANLAFKLDPVTLSSTVTTGLVAPYTYSDMTGAGLGLVVNPPAG